MDPLVLLRQFHSSGKPVLRDEVTRELIFDRTRIPASLQTRFRAKKGDGAPYTVEALWFLLQKLSLPHSQYMDECSKAGIPSVTFVDRKDLLAYLNGTKDEDQVPQISKGAVPSIPPPTAPVTASNDEPMDTTSDESKLDFGAPTPLSAEAAAAKATLAQKLQRYGSTSVTSNVDSGMQSSLNVVPEGMVLSGLSKEKIQEMRDRFKKKKTDQSEASTASTAALAKATSETTSKVLVRERQLHDRKTILQAPLKTFTKIMDMFKEIKKVEKKPVEKKPSYDRFSYNEEQIWKQRGVGGLDEDFQIDTRGTFAGGSLAALTVNPEPAPAPQKKRARDEAESTQSRSVSSESTTEPSPKRQKPAYKPASLNPIIIVPSVTDEKSILSIYNARDFLEFANFQDSEEKRKATGGRPRKVEFYRKKKDDQVLVTIVDNPSRLSEAEWDRVVAVFVLGAPWQFSGWRISEPAVLFSKVRGYFLTFDDEKPPAPVLSWNVKILTVNRIKRHLDKSANEEFWKSLEEFCSVHRPEIKI